MKPASYLTMTSAVVIISLFTFLAPPSAFTSAISSAPSFTVPDLLEEPEQSLFNPNLDYFEEYKKSSFPAGGKLRIALQSIHEGNFSEAKLLAEDYIAGNDQSAPAYEILGVAQAMLGDVENAFLSLQKAVDISPSQSSAITKIGDLYLARKEKEKAFAAFSKAVNVNPDNYRAHQRLGALFDETGDMTQAIDHYEKGLSGTPSDYVGIKVDLGRLYNKQQFFNKSVELLDTLITPKSNNVTGLIVLGTAYLALNQPVKAEKLFKKASDLDPVRGTVALGIAYRQLGEYDKSFRVLQNALKIEPKAATLYFQLGEGYLQLNQYSDALQSYEAAKSAGFQERAVLDRQAQIYMSLQKFAQAITIYKSFLADHSAVPADYVALAEAYRLDKQINNAEEVYKKLTADYPDIAYSWYRTGLFHGYTMQYEKAIADFRSALSYKNGDRHILKSLAVTYSQAGKHRKAVETARAVVASSSPNEPNDLFYLASLLQDREELQEAEKIYNKVLMLQADHVLSLNNLASISADRGDYDEAYAMASKAVALAPDNGRLQDTLGWIEFKRGHYEEAIKILSDAIDKAPTIAVIHYHLGASLHAVGKNKAAKEYIEKALTSKAFFKGREGAEELVRTL